MPSKKRVKDGQEIVKSSFSLRQSSLDLLGDLAKEENRNLSNALDTLIQEAAPDRLKALRGGA